MGAGQTPLEAAIAAGKQENIAKGEMPYCMNIYISVLERVVGACKWKGDTPIWAMRWSVY